tara:strand:- start:442 stop:1881 length:1440 start_codon:yes stop_codon:yes gene_type:complete
MTYNNEDPRKQGLAQWGENNPDATPTDEYSGDNNYRLQTLSITSPSGGEVEINDIFTGVSIYEDLFTNTISCSVSFHDTNDITRHLPIIGQQEKLKAKFTIPGDEDIEFEFDIYKVSVKQISTVGKKQAVTIKGVSTEQFKNIHTRISRSFYDSIDNTIKTIFKDYLKTDGSGKQHKLHIDVPMDSEKRKFIIPNWHPFDAIEWLLNRGVPNDKKSACNYVFFQNRTGFHLTTIDKLMDEEKPKMEYFYMPRRYREAPADFRDPGYEMRNVQRLIFDEPGDRLDENMSGMYSGKILTHDIVRKHYEFKEYKMKDEFNKTKHAEKYYPISQELDEFAKHPDTFFNFCPIHKTLNQENELYGGDTVEQNEKYAEWLLNRKSLMRQVGTNIINIHVSGDSRRKPGDIVTLKVTPLQPAVGKDKKLNKYINGKYLVTSVKHNLTRDGYWMDVELSKDSMNDFYPQQSNFLGSMDEINGVPKEE